MSITYSSRFKAPEEVHSYETLEYGPGSYSMLMWDLEKDFLDTIVRAHKAQVGKLKALDFACGTGRVTQFLEPIVETIRGVDISQEMVTVARERCHKAVFASGDVCTDNSLAGSGYNLVTAFRFFLNTEPSLRASILAILRKAIDPKTGLLILNLHGSTRSLRHFAVLRKQRLLANAHGEIPESVMLNELHPAEMEFLLRSSGFEILHKAGFGLFPSGCYRGGLWKILFMIDHLCSATWITKLMGIDLIYVCRPA